MGDTKGYICLVLHSHLPWIKHTEYDSFLEEDWLFEAITECYIPLYNVIKKLEGSKIEFKLVFSFTPTLCEMLVDEVLMSRYKRYIERLIELAEREIKRTENSPQMNKTARMYYERFTNAQNTLFGELRGNLLNGFKQFQDLGLIEIITSSATHAFLPLLLNEQIVELQIKVGVDNYKKHFGKNPRGFWLPECAYRSDCDRILKKYGIEYFFVDTHGLIYANPFPTNLVYAPIETPHGVLIFGRDVETSKSVWSAIEGYPGDPFYREFYRDIGYDAPYDYIKPYLHNDGVRRNIGIKYHRITGKVDLGAKELYEREKALERADIHAGNFVFNRTHQVNYLLETLKINPVVTAMYDTELFGHWWFEGPDFLEKTISKLSEKWSTIKTIFPLETKNFFKEMQIVEPSQSSWGDKGYFEVWLNGRNDWTYRYLHEMENRLIEVLKKTSRGGAPCDKATERVLKQTVREFLLAQSSDWQFLMTVEQKPIYPIKRIRNHIFFFNSLLEMIDKNNCDENILQHLEQNNSLFQELNINEVINIISKY